MEIAEGVLGAAWLAAVLSLAAIMLKRELCRPKAPVKSFKEDLDTVLGQEELEGFLDRWRGRAPAGRTRVRPEDVLAEGIVAPEQVVPWPSHVTEPCWIEWKREGVDAQVQRAATGKSTTISNAGYKGHLHWRLVRITRNPL